MTPSHTLRALALSFVLVLAACGSPAASGGEHMKLSLKDLMKLGKNYSCTFAEKDADGNKSDGTIYVQGGDKNFRADFVVTADGKMHNSHMITASKTSYMWTEEEEPQGIMMKLKDDDSLFGEKSKDSPEKDDQAIAEDKPMDMDCQTWSPDSGKFTPPKDRKFIDFEEQMKAMMGGKDAKAAQCGACDQIPDEAGKAQCKKALGC